jgi:hypothetical protein
LCCLCCCPGSYSFSGVLLLRLGVCWDMVLRSRTAAVAAAAVVAGVALRRNRSVSGSTE